jgi:hypothetical protein
VSDTRDTAESKREKREKRKESRCIVTKDLFPLSVVLLEEKSFFMDKREKKKIKIKRDRE